MLESSYPGRTYSTGLLSRCIQRGKELHFGKDPHSLTKFMEQGFSIRNDGGCFKFQMNMSQELKAVYIQVGQRTFAQYMPMSDCSVE